MYICMTYISSTCPPQKLYPTVRRRACVPIAIEALALQNLLLAYKVSAPYTSDAKIPLSTAVLRTCPQHRPAYNNTRGEATYNTHLTHIATLPSAPQTSCGLLLLGRELLFPVVRGREVGVGADGHDPELVDGRVAPIVVLLDVVHVDRVPDGLHLEQLLGVVEDVGVLADALLVALEVHHIHLGTKTRAGMSGETTC